MSLNHVVVWLDHAQAHVIHFNREAAEADHIKNSSTHSNAHPKAGAGENSAFLNEIAATLKDAQEILIVGPGLEKMNFIKHLHKHHHTIADQVVAVETVDHPSDGQLLAYARKYFVKVDIMR